MKVSGPRIQQAPAPEPKNEPGTLRGGNRRETNGSLPSIVSPRDSFQPGASNGPVRAGNQRLGESHADNIAKGPDGTGGAAPTVQAGSLHTLLNRLFPKPGTPSREPGSVTNGSRIRPGDGHGDLVTLGLTKPGGPIAPGIDTGIVAPKPTSGSKPKTLLSKSFLQNLNSPELTPKLVNKLAKATTLKKVEKLTRDLAFDLRNEIMRAARVAADGDARYGGSKADNLQT